MSEQNVRPTELVAALGNIPPTAQAVGTITTAWLFAGNFNNILAAIRCGALGASGTVSAAIQQATSSAGANAKFITGKSITALATNNQTALINLNPQELDTNNGFCYIQLQITVATATSQVQGDILGFSARNLPAYSLNGADVVQVVL